MLMATADDLDGDGVLSLSPSVPAHACDRPFVVFDRDACVPSNVATPTPIAPEVLWIGDSREERWIASGLDAPADFLNLVMYPAAAEDRFAPCGDPLAPPVLSHVVSAGDSGVVRSWTAADDGFEQVAACLTDGEEQQYWFRHQIDEVADVGEGAGYTLSEAWFVHETFCHLDGGATYYGYDVTDVCDLAGFVVTRIDLVVASLEFTAEGFDYTVFYSFYGHMDD